MGINLLREGLDLPEVALVAVLDADKEGFLRSATSLIQTMGRAARNVHGRVLLYAERVTAAMLAALEESSRRRTLQEAHNAAHGIVPRSTTRSVDRSLAVTAEDEAAPRVDALVPPVPPAELRRTIEGLRRRMLDASERLEFEEAARLRDQVRALEQAELRYL